MSTTLSDAAVGGHWHAAPVVAADDIRTALTGTAVIDPRGVRVEGARITGRLDLSHVRTSVRLEFTRCEFDEPVVAEGAELQSLTLDTTTAPAIHADGVVVRRDVDIIGCELAVLRLAAAHIGGRLRMSGSRLDAPPGQAAMPAERLRVDGGVFLDDGFSAEGDTEGALVDLTSAHVTGPFTMHRAAVRNASGAALSLERVQIDGPGLQLGVGFEASGSGPSGAVLLLAARISDTLSFRGATLTNPSGPALFANRLDVGGAVFLDRGMRASGRGMTGTVTLVSTRIGGPLGLGDATITNSAGPALSADWIRTGMAIVGDNLRATGCGEDGAVRLLGAQVAEELVLTGARLTNKTGPALIADRVQVEGNALLDGDFTADGGGSDATIRLLNARIAGQLRMTGATLTHASSFVLDLDGAAVAGKVFVPMSLVCDDSTRRRPRCTYEAGRIDLDDFRFGKLADTEWKDWLHLVQRHTRTYRPGAYQQLASAERAAGHDGIARKILIAQQQDRRERGQIGGPHAWVGSVLWGTFAGHGYRGLRLSVVLLVVLACSGLLGAWAGNHETGDGFAAERTLASGRAGEQCSLAERIGVGIDRGLPLAPLGTRTKCDLDTGTRAGERFAYAIWALQFVVWLLATLALVSYTNLIRRPT